LLVKYNGNEDEQASIDILDEQKNITNTVVEDLKDKIKDISQQLEIG
jgi:hypothetical protein